MPDEPQKVPLSLQTDLVPIDLTDEAAQQKLQGFLHLEKLAGLIRAAQAGLPVSSTGFIVVSPTTDLTVLHSRPSLDILLCRPDAPLARSRLLPRGRDLSPAQIPAFLRDIQVKVPGAALLVFRHPSYQFSGVYVPRYRLSGAMTVLLSPNDSLVLEFVGPGFDVGDLTRGRTVHMSVSVPWSERFCTLMDILKQSKYVYRTYYRISSTAYATSRVRRIAELTTSLGEHAVYSIENSVPKTFLPPPLHQLTRLWATCVLPCLLPTGGAFHVSNEPILLLVNIYGTSPHLFELWRPYSRATLSGGPALSTNGPPQNNDPWRGSGGGTLSGRNTVSTRTR